MKTNIIIILVAILGFVMLSALFWYSGTRSAQARHCIEYLDGVPIRSGDNIVCLRKDAVL